MTFIARKLIKEPESGKLVEVEVVLSDSLGLYGKQFLNINVNSPLVREIRDNMPNLYGHIQNDFHKDRKEAYRK